MAKRTEITIETREIVVIRRSRNLPLAYCPACGDSVAMASAPQAAAIGGVVARVIRERVEQDTVHHVETPDGRLLICLNSLMS